MFRSTKHEVHTIEVNKVALNRDDNKWIIKKDGISTFARGHKDLSWSPILRELSLFDTTYKMRHSNFKCRSHPLSAGVEGCSCGQTFYFTSEREWKIKLGVHRKVCSNPSKDFEKVRAPLKAITLKEYYNNKVKSIRKARE